MRANTPKSCLFELTNTIAPPVRPLPFKSAGIQHSWPLGRVFLNEPSQPFAAIGPPAIAWVDAAMSKENTILLINANV